MAIQEPNLQMHHMSALRWRPATFSLCVNTLVVVVLGYVVALLLEPGTVKMQEYSKVNKEKELSSVFFCDIVSQQSTQTVRLLNYWLECRELISFFGREARDKTIKLTHCMSATNTHTKNLFLVVWERSHDKRVVFVVALGCCLCCLIILLLG